MLNDTDTLRREYDQSCRELAVIFGADLNSFVLQEIEDLLTFERTLANVCKFHFHYHLM